MSITIYMIFLMKIEALNQANFNLTVKLEIHTYPSPRFFPKESL